MKLSPEVISVLDASTCSERSLALPPIQLDRKLYIEVNKALEALGGKWSKKERVHLFDENPADAIADVITTGSVEDRRKALQFFETPESLADELVFMADIKRTHYVLEPSAGRGSIVRAIKKNQPEAAVFAIEIDPKHTASLGGTTAGFWAADFLKEVPNSIYDRIVANPPFAKQQDIAHVTHMYRFLKPGGFLLSVMSDSVRWRMDRKSVDFRAFVEANGGKLVKLPEGSFKASGTMVSTCYVAINKAA